MGGVIVLRLSLDLHRPICGASERTQQPNGRNRENSRSSGSSAADARVS